MDSGASDDALTVSALDLGPPTVDEQADQIPLPNSLPNSAAVRFGLSRALGRREIIYVSEWVRAALDASQCEE